MHIHAIRAQSGVAKYYDVLEFLERTANLISNPRRIPLPRSAEIEIVNAALCAFRSSATEALDDAVASCVEQIVLEGASNELLLATLKGDPCYWGHLSFGWGQVRDKAVDKILAKLGDSLDKRFSETRAAKSLKDTLQDLLLEDFLPDEAILEFMAAHDELEEPSDEALLDALQVRIDLAREQIEERRARQGLRSSY